jgi:large subunit ribosomal protein L29
VTARAVALDNLRTLTSDELALHLREQRGQLFQVRLQQTIGQVENHRQIRAIRKELARTMTVQSEIRLAAERGRPAPAPRPNAAAAAIRPSRRARAAAVETAATEDSTAGASLVSTDAPVEEAISDVEVERIEPAAAPAPRSRRSKTAATPVSEPDEASDTGASTEADEDTQ